MTLVWAAAQGVRRARPTRVTAQVRLAWGEARGRSDRGRAGRGEGCAPDHGNTALTGRGGKRTNLKSGKSELEIIIIERNACSSVVSS